MVSICHFHLRTGLGNAQLEVVSFQPPILNQIEEHIYIYIVIDVEQHLYLEKLKGCDLDRGIASHNGCVLR